jgi:hypothetical protein
MNSITFPVSRSSLSVSLTWISGFGYLIVLASFVTMYGTLFGPTFFYVTLTNLNLASSGLIDFKMNFPDTSYKTL